MKGTSFVININPQKFSGFSSKPNNSGEAHLSLTPKNGNAKKARGRLSSPNSKGGNKLIGKPSPVKVGKKQKVPDETLC